MSIVTPSAEEAVEVLPAASRAVAVNEWAPLPSAAVVNDHAPPAVAVVVPSDVVPSKIRTRLPASAAPPRVGVASLVMLSVLDAPLSLPASRSMVGALGAVVSAGGVTVIVMSTWFWYVPPPAGPDWTVTVTWPLSAVLLAVNDTPKSVPQLVIDSGSGVAVTPTGVWTSRTRGASPVSMLQPESGSPAALLPTTRMAALPLIPEPATSVTPVPVSAMVS